MEGDISCTDLYNPAGLWRLVLYKKKHYSGHSDGRNFFFGMPVPHTIASVQYAHNTLDNTEQLHERWAAFMVCSMCARRQQRLLFCLFVADRAWVLLAVRPSIHKAILSLIDGDPLNYRLKQEWRLQKNNPCKSFLRAPRISALCVYTKKREKECQEDPKCIFLYFTFPFILAVSLWSDPVWSCYYPGALSVCSCLFRSGLW